eukprot:2177313-Prorocentrum_lima.AAC.1
MTSSLVGSEMCIRDSCEVAKSLGQSSLHCSQQRGADGSSRKIEPPMAVSYTHLTLPTICSV